MGKLIKLYLPLIGAIAILLAGCDKSIGGKTLASHENGAVETRIQSPGKPGAPVRLEIPQPYYLEFPGVSNLELLLSTAIVNGTMLVDVSAGENIELLSLKSPYEFVLSPQKTYEIPLQVSVVKEGRYYINLRIRIVNGEHVENRVITAVLQVGAPATDTLKNKMLKNQNGVNSSSESGIIELPAEESIGPEPSKDAQ